MLFHSPNKKIDIPSIEINSTEVDCVDNFNFLGMFCSSSGFPCVGVRLVYSSLRCTATFIIRFHWSLLLAFSLHFSSSSAFLRSLFTQSSHLSCVLPRFLQPSFFIVSDPFGILLDKHLNWKSQTSKIANTISRTIGVLTK